MSTSSILCAPSPAKSRQRTTARDAGKFALLHTAKIKSVPREFWRASGSLGNERSSECPADSWGRDEINNLRDYCRVHFYCMDLLSQRDPECESSDVRATREIVYETAEQF